MVKRWPKSWAVPLAILFLGTANVVGPHCSTVLAQQPVNPGGKSWTDSITSPFKQGFDKLSSPFKSKKSAAAAAPGAEDDAVSLANNAKPGAELYVAIARLYQQQGKMAEAEKQYQLALNEKPNDLPALLGYAQLKESAGKPNEAIDLYKRAAKAHPQEASVYNNLGLYHARQQRLDEAVAAMARAVQLEPKNALYRNNIATLLVDQGRSREAIGQLLEVHTPAAAHYNMGYLLNKKGQSQAALQHFALAAQADPSMDSARWWVEHLQKTTAQARLSQSPTGVALKPASRPTMPREDAMLPPEPPMPRRLPPTTLQHPASRDSTLPGISYERSTAPDAPLPPPLNSAVRPLPRVD